MDVKYTEIGNINMLKTWPGMHAIILWVVLLCEQLSFKSTWVMLRAKNFNLDITLLSSHCLGVKVAWSDLLRGDI